MSYVEYFCLVGENQEKIFFPKMSKFLKSGNLLQTGIPAQQSFKRLGELRKQECDTWTSHTLDLHHRFKATQRHATGHAPSKTDPFSCIYTFTHGYHVFN